MRSMQKQKFFICPEGMEWNSRRDWENYREVRLNILKRVQAFYFKNRQMGMNHAEALASVVDSALIVAFRGDFPE